MIAPEGYGRLPIPPLQFRHGRRRLWQRQPADDGPRTLPRSGVVDDARKPPAQLDGGGQLAVTLEYLTDRGGIGFGDDEHLPMMTARGTVGKRRECNPDSPDSRRLWCSGDVQACLRLES